MFNSSKTESEENKNNEKAVKFKEDNLKLNEEIKKLGNMCKNERIKPQGILKFSNVRQKSMESEDQWFAMVEKLIEDNNIRK